jgi:formylmethanofuran dehydrogenase subunit E
MPPGDAKQLSYPGQLRTGMQLDGLMVIPEHELFEVSEVAVKLPPEEMPGAHPPKIVRGQCGVLVRSGQAIKIDGQDLCAGCSNEAYFTLVDQEGV